MRTSTYIIRHGLSQLEREPIYTIWQAIKTRCYNKNFKQYNDYGGRGIVMCNEWLNSPDVFINWCIKNGWEKGLQIDRVKNDLGYTPNNCVFNTSKQNNRNRRSNVHINIDGVDKILIEWCEFYNIKYEIVRKRLIRGWDTKKALTTAIINKKNRISNLNMYV